MYVGSLLFDSDNRNRNRDPDGMRETTETLELWISAAPRQFKNDSVWFAVIEHRDSILAYAIVRESPQLAITVKSCANRNCALNKFVALEFIKVDASNGSTIVTYFSSQLRNKSRADPSLAAKLTNFTLASCGPPEWMLRFANHRQIIIRSIHLVRKFTFEEKNESHSEYPVLRKSAGGGDT